jgi:hypothetical protein
MVVAVALEFQAKLNPDVEDPQESLKLHQLKKLFELLMQLSISRKCSAQFAIGVFMASWRNKPLKVQLALANGSQ